MARLSNHDLDDLLRDDGLGRWIYDQDSRRWVLIEEADESAVPRRRPRAERFAGDRSRRLDGKAGWSTDG